MSTQSLRNISDLDVCSDLDNFFISQSEGLIIESDFGINTELDLIKSNMLLRLERLLLSETCEIEGMQELVKYKINKISNGYM
mgnify:CR=1 FL=1